MFNTLFIPKTYTHQTCSKGIQCLVVKKLFLLVLHERLLGTKNVKQLLSNFEG